ncbi:MAG: GNAT family N-acetyltransferase [Acutalibacteraceae bacterium]
MKYIPLTEQNISSITEKYVEYYNTYEDGCWKYPDAFKRIHQIMTIEDSMCLVQLDESDNVTGFAIGYFKLYDDLTEYYLEEIVIFKEYQNKGCGSDFLRYLEKTAKEHGALHFDLVSVNDEHHMHFYKKAGFYCATNLSLMGKNF